jgi:hypothetical protein
MDSNQKYYDKCMSQLEMSIVEETYIVEDYEDSTFETALEEVLSIGIANSYNSIISHLRDVVAKKIPFIVRQFWDYRHDLDAYLCEKNYSYVPNSTLILAPYFSFRCLTTGENVVLDTPSRTKTVAMPPNVFKDLCFSSEQGFLSDTLGTKCVDYCALKQDGIQFICFSRLDVSKKSVICCDNIYQYSDYSGVSFCGELLADNKLILQIGYYGIVTATEIQVGSITYAISHAFPLTPEEIMRLDPQHIEGLIVSVDGTEYKVKVINSVELMYDGTRVITQDKIPYASFGDPGPIGVNEYNIVDGKAIFIRPRFDKLIAQNQPTIHHVVTCPTFQDFRHVFLKYYDKVVFQKFNDMLSLSDAKYHLKHLLQSSKGRLITIDVIKRAFLCNGLRTDFTVLANNIGIPNRGMKRFSDEEIAEWKVSLSRVSCSDIFHYIKKTKLCMPINDMCLTLMNKHFTVAPRRLFLMSCRGSFSCVADSVYVARFKKYVKPADVVERIMSFRNDPVSAVAAYAIRNRNMKFSRDLVYDHLVDTLDACENLFSQCPSGDIMRDCVGDVVMSWLRLIDEKYPSYGILDDEMIRNLFDRSHIFFPYKRKLQERMMTYGCIRNHATAGNHQCCSGEHFKRNKD